VVVLQGGIDAVLRAIAAPNRAAMWAAGMWEREEGELGELGARRKRNWRALTFRSLSSSRLVPAGVAHPHTHTHTHTHSLSHTRLHPRSLGASSAWRGGAAVSFFAASAVASWHTLGSGRYASAGRRQSVVAGCGLLDVLHRDRYISHAFPPRSMKPEARPNLPSSTRLTWTRLTSPHHTLTHTHTPTHTLTPRCNLAPACSRTNPPSRPAAAAPLGSCVNRRWWCWSSRAQSSVLVASQCLGPEAAMRFMQSRAALVRDGRLPIYTPLACSSTEPALSSPG
jgi:hypothetical protein